MNTKSLVILAAGLSSRYKASKQSESIHHGKSLMEFSLENAKEAGFNHFVFIVNNQFPSEQKERLRNNYPQVEIDFVVQTAESFIPNTFQKIEEERKKPWGTGHAILCAKNFVRDYFAVINADDYYGKNGFQRLSHHFSSNKNLKVPILIAYPVQDTLSKFGTVNRGICKVEDAKYLLEIVERKVEKKNNIIIDEMGNPIEENTPVSMNFWGMHSFIFDDLENEFIKFILSNPRPQEEFFFPDFMNKMLINKSLKIKLEVSNDEWFGLTFPEDREMVQNKLIKLYP